MTARATPLFAIESVASFRHGFKLVQCEPYRCKLTAESCAERWRIAQAASGAKGIAGNDAINKSWRKRNLAHCIGCKVGEGRNNDVSKRKMDKKKEA